MNPILSRFNNEQADQLRKELRTNLYGRRALGAPYKPATQRKARPQVLRILEQRADDIATDTTTDTLTVSGYSAVFDHKTELGFSFFGIRFYWHEVIARGFFRKALSASDLDCCFLVNHDPNLLLARTTNKTLRLEERTHGLYSEADLIDNTLGRDTYALIERGDMHQQSFAFTLSDDGDEWDDTEAYDTLDDPDTPDEVYLGLRTLKECEKLYDTSPVTYPAYPTTTISTERSAVATDQAPSAIGEESNVSRELQRSGEGSDQQLTSKGNTARSNSLIPDNPNQEKNKCHQSQHRYSNSETESQAVSIYSRKQPPSKI